MYMNVEKSKLFFAFPILHLYETMKLVHGVCCIIIELMTFLPQKNESIIYKH